MGQAERRRDNTDPRYSFKRKIARVQGVPPFLAFAPHPRFPRSPPDVAEQSFTKMAKDGKKSRRPNIRSNPALIAKRKAPGVDRGKLFRDENECFNKIRTQDFSEGSASFRWYDLRLICNCSLFVQNREPFRCIADWRNWRLVRAMRLRHPIS
jgi:hypothetical protein